MAGTPIDLANPYIPPGIREFVFVPSGGIVVPSTPTRTELETGTNLTRAVVDWSGWSLETAFVDDASLESRIVGQIAGMITPPASSLTFKASKTSTDVRQILPQDTEGFVVVFPEGDGPKNGGLGTTMDVWPVTVASESMDGGLTDRAQRLVSFATNTPSLNVTIPTSP